MPSPGPSLRLARLAAAALLVFTLTSCDASPSLVVVVRSDLVPGLEVDQAVVSVELADGLDAPRATTEIGPDTDLLSGRRVLDLSDVPLGTTRVDLDLRLRGRVVAERLVIVEFVESRVATIVVTRSCETTRCPGIDDSAERTECLGGRCVDPRCTVETPESCVPPACDADEDCAQTMGCTLGRCDESGVCLSVPDDASCRDAERCLPDGRCVADDMDAGPRPDGGADAGPPVDDAGRTDAGGTRCGDPSECDDGNACTDDDCVMGDCQNTPNTAACDDMVFCNGLDQCMGGSCAGHAGDPCTGGTTCNEAMDVCEGCTSDAECGMDELGPWGSCGGFSGTCDETGTETRTRRTWSCVSGSCVPNNGTDTRACTRTTAGTTCMATSCGGFGACGYSGSCATTGTRSRMCTDFTCGGGTCNSASRTETTGSGCNRATNGNTCGAGTTCGPYGSCSYGSDCATTGSRTRTCTDRACSAGSCGSSTRTETDTSGCGRSTLGMTCGAGTTCGPYGACSYGSACATSGTRSRTCTDRTCTIGGTCGSSMRSETTGSGCGRSTNGNTCGAGTTCGAWSACTHPTVCSNSGSRTRTCTDRACSGGSCGSSMRTETDTAACTRNTNGNTCNDGDPCTGPDQCGSGMCFGLPECRPSACPGGGCFPMCTGNCLDGCECLP